MEGSADRFITIVVMYLGGMALAAGFFMLVRSALRSVRGEINRSRGAERPEWAPGIWMCARCRSSNHPSALRCGSCHRPREVLVHDLVEPPPDWIPERVDASSGAIVSLLHEPAAHTDTGAAHWRLKVGGQVVGSAARVAGAAALVRAIEGTDVVAFDVRGTGAVTFRLTDLIARLEGPRFPVEVACPERGLQR